eukprot:15099971-Alexandrium_andersonii.AAC.1
MCIRDRVGRHRRVYSGGSAALQAGSSRVQQFRAVSSSFLRSLSGGLLHPDPPEKRLRRHGARGALR